MAAELKDGVAGLTIGLPREMFAEGLSADVREAVMHAADTLRSLGADIYLEC